MEELVGVFIKHCRDMVKTSPRFAGLGDHFSLVFVVFFFFLGVFFFFIFIL
jgi:hypothetical protein